MPAGDVIFLSVAASIYLSGMAVVLYPGRPSRDLDSRISARESAAVREWLSSEDHAFHFMRDNPAHGIEILGSGWAARKADLERTMTDEAFKMAAKDKMFWAGRKAYGPDQGFLKRWDTGSSIFLIN